MLGTISNFGMYGAPQKTYTQILSQTTSSDATSISLDISGVDMVKYVDVLVIAKVITSATTDIRCTVNNITTGYYGNYIASGTTAVTAINGGANIGPFYTTTYSASFAETTSIAIDIKNSYLNIGSTSEFGVMSIGFEGGYANPGNKFIFGAAGVRSPGQITSIQFFASSGNIVTDSEFRIYGIKR